MTHIRELNLNDLVKLEENASFPLPNLENKLYCIKMALEYKGEVICIFWVKITSELSLIFDRKTSPIKKASALVDIDKFLSNKLHGLGIDDIHLFIQDSKFSKLLTRHFNFKIVSGDSLFRRL